MKKIIKFLPLVVLPSLIVMACANAQTNNKVSQDTTNNDNGITEYTVTVDFNGGTFEGEPTKEYKVRKDTYYQYFKGKLPKDEQIAYPSHELKYYSLSKDGSEIDDKYRFQEDKLTIYAVYRTEGAQYKVTWRDPETIPYYGHVWAEEYYYKGETPKYKGVTPTHSEPGMEFTFDGWNPEIVEVTADTTYYAHYTYVATEHAVAFDAKGGEAVPTQLIFHGDTILIAPTTSREGYHQTDEIKNKWYYMDQDVEKEFIFGIDGNATKVTHDFNLYCKWVPNNVTVSFNAGEGSQYFDPQTVEYGATVQMDEPKPTKVKATFDAWYTQPEGKGTKFIFDDGKAANPTHVTEDTMLYANWIDIETVTLTFKIEDSVKAFASWKCEGQDPKYEIGLTVDAGTSGIDPTTYEDEAHHIFTLTIDDSMILAGWQEKESGIIYPTIPAANNNADYTATIVGKKEAIHSVYFYDKATDAEPMFTESVIHGEHAIKPADPTSTGKVFKYWTVKNGAGGAFPFDTYEITTDEHLVAVYEDAKYTITFNAGEGSQYIKPIEDITSGSTVPMDKKPSSPSKEKYDFDDWYTEPEGKGTKFVFDDGKGTQEPAPTVVTSDITLYANWLERKTVSLDFMIDGASQGFAGWYAEGVDMPLYSHAMTPNYGDKVDPTADFVKDGHTYKWRVDDSRMLVGWRDNYTQIIYAEVPEAKIDANYTAVFKEKPATTIPVNFNFVTNITGEEGQEKYVYDDKFVEQIISGDYAIEPKNPRIADIENYDFIGWYNEPQEAGEDKGTPFDFDTPITAATEIYAHYKKQTLVKVSFYDENGDPIPMTKDTQPAGHDLITPVLEYKFIDTARVTVDKWKIKGEDEVVTTVPNHDVDLEPFSYVEVPFDVKLDAYDPIAQKQFTFDMGETSIETQIIYGKVISFQFDGDGETEKFPSSITITLTDYQGSSQSVSEEMIKKWYNPENGKILITVLDYTETLEQIKSIDIKVQA